MRDSHGERPHDRTGLRARAPTEDELIGTWQAVQLEGKLVTVDESRPSNLDRLDFSRLNGQLTWGAPFACNSAGGQFDLLADGTVIPTFGSTQIGCGSRWDGVKAAANPMLTVVRVSLGGDQLRFYNADDRVVGVFERVN